MRILTGRFKGRALRTAEGPGYRPAMGKVRAALFSMLEARGLDFTETAVLDLFAGSGSLGFEALSRGAPRVVFVEDSPAAARLIRKNAELFGLEPGEWQVAEEEVRRWLQKPPFTPFALIFIDPPYGQNLLPATIKGILGSGRLAPGGVINAEVEAKIAFDPQGPDFTGLELLVDRNYGQTRVILWTKTA